MPVNIIFFKHDDVVMVDANLGGQFAFFEHWDFQFYLTKRILSVGIF